MLSSKFCIWLPETVKCLKRLRHKIIWEVHSVMPVVGGWCNFCGQENCFWSLLKPNKKPNVALLFSEVLMVYLGPVQATVNRSCYVACWCYTTSLIYTCTKALNLMCTCVCVTSPNCVLLCILFQTGQGHTSRGCRRSLFFTHLCFFFLLIVLDCLLLWSHVLCLEESHLSTYLTVKLSPHLAFW